MADLDGLLTKAGQYKMPMNAGGYGGASPMSFMDDARQRFNKEEEERQRKMVQDSMMHFMQPSGHGMFFTGNNQMVDVGGQHLLRAIGQDDLAARQAEMFNYSNVQNAARGVREAAEQGATDVRNAGSADLARMKAYGDEAVGIADQSFLDVQKQFGDAQKKYDRDIAKAYATQQQAIAQAGRSSELQQSAVASAIAQQQSERRDMLAAQMGGAVSGTTDQFQDAARQMQAEADRLKFKSLTDIAVERDRTTSSLQQNLASMQQRGAEFGAGFAQTGANLSMQSAQQKMAARQMAASLYSASAQQQAQAAQVSAQMRMAGRETEARFLAARPFSPVSMLQTYIAAMNAKKTIPQNIFGGNGGGGVVGPMQGMNARIMEDNGGGRGRGSAAAPAAAATAKSPASPAQTQKQFSDSAMMSGAPSGRTPNGRSKMDMTNPESPLYDWGMDAYNQERAAGMPWAQPK